MVGRRPCGPHRALISLSWVCDLNTTQTWVAGGAPFGSVISKPDAGCADRTVAILPWQRTCTVPPSAVIAWPDGGGGTGLGTVLGVYGVLMTVDGATTTGTVTISVRYAPGTPGTGTSLVVTAGLTPGSVAGWGSVAAGGLGRRSGVTVGPAGPAPDGAVGPAIDGRTATTVSRPQSPADTARMALSAPTAARGSRIGRGDRVTTCPPDGHGPVRPRRPERLRPGRTRRLRRLAVGRGPWPGSAARCRRPVSIRRRSPAAAMARPRHGPGWFRLAAPGPGQLVREQLVGQHTEGVDVGSRRNVAAKQPFWRQIGRCAQDLAVIIWLWCSSEGGDAEVDDLGAATGEHHIGRLDVAVDQPVLVERGERVGDLGADGDRLGGRQGVGDAWSASVGPVTISMTTKGSGSPSGPGDSP